MIIAGEVGEGQATSRLFEWDGKSEARPVPGITLAGLNPEGVAFHDEKGTGEYVVLSDDGTLAVDGQACKDLKDPSLKRFRGQVLEF